LEVIDLTEPGFLFTNGAGNPVRAQEFYNGGAHSRSRRPCRLCFDTPDGDGGSGSRSSIHIDWIAALI
jgi:hypothetical protein